MTKRERIAQLERKLRETEAQLAHVYWYAANGVADTDCTKHKGGGIVVQIHWLGGKEVCPPFMVKDGFSPESIAALRADIRRSYESATEIAPPTE